MGSVAGWKTQNLQVFGGADGALGGANVKAGCVKPGDGPLDLFQGALDV